MGLMLDFTNVHFSFSNRNKILYLSNSFLFFIFILKRPAYLLITFLKTHVHIIQKLFLHFFLKKQLIVNLFHHIL